MLIANNSWVVENLENALNTWNEKLSEIWSLITQTPETFKGGIIWDVILEINHALLAIGYSLLVLFFVMGLLKTCSSLTDVKKPEHAFKLFLRFAISKGVVTYGVDIMMAVFKIVQGILSTIMTASGFGSAITTVLPYEITRAIEACSFWHAVPLWAITLIGSLFVIILSFVMILTVYGRYFKLFLFTGISPVPLATIAGESTQYIGKNFFKSYVGVCLEGVIIVLSCVIFSLFASSPPVIDTNASAITQVSKYLVELIFNMLVLVGTIKMSDHVVKEMMGL